MNDQTDNTGDSQKGLAQKQEESEPEKDRQASEDNSGETAAAEKAHPPLEKSSADEHRSSQGSQPEETGQDAGHTGESAGETDGQHASLQADSPSAEDAPAKSGEKSTKDSGEPKKAVEGPLKLVGVKFRQAGKTYYFNAESLRFHIGEKIIVETDRGLGIARVMTPVIETAPEEAPPEIKRVIRKANWNDLERNRKNLAREEEAEQLCKQKIAERGLAMKLVRVEYLHDASKAIFYFTAEHRVDFRELVKDLARQLHTRIEMRQIGVRDETKLLGGIGPCGRKVCCASFLTDFSPVSVRMAKDQNLAMNPAKVSGLCGRLMCCLAYEHDLYRKLVKTMPKKGKKMISAHGPCRVIDLNILARKVLVELESGKTVFVPVDELKTLQEAQAEEEAEQTLDDIEAPEEIWESDDPSALEKLEKKAMHEKTARNHSREVKKPEAPGEQTEKKRPAGREQQEQKSRRKRGKKKKDNAQPKTGPQQKTAQDKQAGQEKAPDMQPPPGTKPHSKRSRKRKRKKKTT